ncbi:Retrotransposon polyprotein [Penicillium verhagenii]|uniref:Retrotransposon polyprotein n=1 Tax=Penicillium verhagenii TaxID=1562060 RepID=UPI00254554EB|nr:Retrotransposon polyprotein [Penicillium verhagenii]KAJ5919015.1 Retrotransposon polyprotein [Penicillium verhagenii]
MAPNEAANNQGGQRTIASVAPPATATPTNEQLMAMVSQLQEQLVTLNNRSAPVVKPPKPAFFEGARTQLRSFLTQMEMQLRIIRCSEEADKVIYASTYLRGQAFNWFEPYIREFNEKPMKKWSDTTKDIFGSYDKFKQKLEQTFGDIDAVRTVERKLDRLRQTGSASSYAAEFQQIISHLDMDDDTYIWLFERGLKEEVKDELMRIDRPDELSKLIEVAVKFDNRLYERAQQRRESKQWKSNSSRPYHPRSGARRQQPRESYSDPYGPQPMELDAARLPDEEQKRRKEQRLCFSCGKPGYMSRDCRSKSNRPQQIRATQDRGAYDITGLKNKGKAQQLRATQEIAERYDSDEFAEIEWTDDVCGNTAAEEPQPETQGRAGRTSMDARALAAASQQTDQPGPTATDGATVPRSNAFKAWKAAQTPTESPKINNNTATNSEERVRQLYWELREISSQAKVKQDELERRLQKQPRPVNTEGSCPCRDELCACMGFKKHPQHRYATTNHCYEKDCEEHNWKRAALAYAEPVPKWKKLPNWKPAFQQLAATKWGAHLKIEANILLQPAKVLIDSGACGNFMDPRCAHRLQVQLHQKTRATPITGLNGESLGPGMTHESGPLPMIIGNHLESIEFDITNLGGYDVVLGMPWLERHNPAIHWGTRQIDFVNCECKTANRQWSGRPLPNQGTGSGAGAYERPQDEKPDVIFRPEGGVHKTNDASIIRELEQRPDMSDDELKEYVMVHHEKSLCATKEGTPELPQEYQEFQDVFTAPPIGQLPEHGPHDHQIPIQKGKEPKHMPIYHVLEEYLDTFVVVYLDDILVFSKTEEEHTGYVRKVLEKLREAKVTLKLKKCEFYVQETGFLGYIISNNSFSMEEEKIRSILEWPQLKTVKEVQQFLGLCNYYRRSIDGFGKIVAGLNWLTKKDQVWEWDEAADKSFKGLKELFQARPIIHAFDPELPVTVKTDASDYAIGARLTQEIITNGIGGSKPIAFWSRKMIPAELNYDVHDKELLAIVSAFKVWRPYLEGAKHQVLVKSDHMNLTFFTTTKTLTRRQARWAETLSQYDYRIEHCEGRTNSQADALSRRPDYQIGVKDTVPAILKADEKGNLVYNHQTLAATKATGDDQRLQDMVNEGNNGKAILDEGILLVHGLVYVPQRMQEEIIQQHHDAPSRGHLGVEKTVELITRNFYVPNVHRKVRNYIQQCDTCQRDKPSRHQPYGGMQNLEVPTKPWEWITMDFITKLPISDGHDMIMVIVDRLTKYAYMIPTTETIDAQQMANILIRNVFANHGSPRKITSDRDKLFTSNMWRSFADQIGIEHRLSTAYHPQTNGQTERTNQTLEQYLRHYVNYQQDDWAGLLPIAQFAYNNAMHATTKESPFFANYGYNPAIIGEPIGDHAVAESSRILAANIKQLHGQMARDIDFFNLRMKSHYDKSHKEGPTLEKGRDEKLDHRKLGPFTIEERTGPVNYRLRLPESMKRMHPVFHISLLEKAPENTPIATNVEIEDASEQEYEVEEILADRWKNSQQQLLVKWQGYPTEENTWEPIKNLRGCHRLVQQYYQKAKRTPEGRQQRKNRNRRRSSPQTQSSASDKTRMLSNGRSSLSFTFIFGTIGIDTFLLEPIQFILFTTLEFF